MGFGRVVCVRVPTSLADVQPHPRYPVDALSGVDSALMLFCAGFYGASDCVHLANLGIEHVVAVDRDREKIEAMRAIYPKTWEFLVADAYEICKRSLVVDFLGVDPPVNGSERALRSLSRFCEIARRRIVIGTTLEAYEQTTIAVSNEWRRRDPLMRNDRACWLVWERR